MLYRSYPREKSTPFFLRIIWRTYYLIRRIIPAKILLKTLLNTVWALNALSWEQTRLYEKTSDVESTVDVLRPRNVLDATTDLRSSDRICDFGGGLGDISNALIHVGCEVVYCDTNPMFQMYVKKRFADFPNFKIADSTDVLTGKAGLFELVVLSHVLEHIDNPVDFLKNIGKISKRIHIEVPDLTSDSLNFIRMQLDLPVYKDDDHVIEMSMEHLRNLIADSNFIVESIISRDGCLVARAKSNAI